MNKQGVSFASFAKQARKYAALASLLMAAPLALAAEVVSGDVLTIVHAQSGQQIVWRLANNPNVFIFDFPSLQQQGRTFNRATQLTEQFNEPYKRVMSSAEFVKYLEAVRRNNANFAFGHDLLASELVLFLNLAGRDKIELFPEELVLRDFLLEQGIIKIWRGIYQTVQQDVVLLSVPQIQERRENEPPINKYARTAIVLHEVAHGEFYTNKYYADYCRKFWNNTLDESQRELFRRFLSNYNYSLNAEELIINEMQAYLMFTPDPASFSAAKLGVTQNQLDTMRDAFANGKPPTKLPIYSQELGVWK